MRTALHAEWTKIWTLASPLWLLLGTVAVTVALSAAVTSVLTCGAAGCDSEDTTKLSLTGIELGQALVAVLAAGVISGEYSTGMIRTTLTAMPHRVTVLAAKAVTLTGAVTAAGTIAVLGSLLAGRLILPGHGFITARGYPALADGPTLRAAAGSVLYLTLIALLSLGIATAVRDSATSIGVVLGLLYLFPIISLITFNPHLQRLLQQIGPMNAGLAVQATTNLRSLPISPWAGLGVLTAWAAAALVTGALSLRLRDI
jgi:ABC-2 type transport system permease protein